MWWRSVVFTGLLMGSFVVLIPHVMWLLSYCVGRLFHYRLPYAPLGWTVLAALLLLWGLLAYGHFVGMWQTEVTEVEYVSQDLPEAFDGYRIVHVSDFHVDTYDQHPEALQAIIDKVNAQKADVILFTGDMCTGGMDAVFLHESALRQLAAPDGVRSVLGNHDFFIYDRHLRTVRQKCEAADRLAQFEGERLGWQVLRNENVILHRGQDSLAIAGVDNINGGQGFRTIQMGDLSRAMSGLDGVFTVLLSHDPSHWEAEVLPRSHAQVTLSGHTHAAQIRLFGWSLAHLSFRQCDGRYDHDGRMLYINAGIGSTAPFRIFAPSEITVITLRRHG